MYGLFIFYRPGYALFRCLDNQSVFLGLRVHFPILFLSLSDTHVIGTLQGQVVEFASPGELLAKKDSIFHGMAVDAGLVS